MTHCTESLAVGAGPSVPWARLRSLFAGATVSRPLMTVIAVFIGAFLTGVHTRLFTITLADLRGQFGLGFDEGAWLGTMLNAPQLLIAPIVPWFAAIYGTRRIVVVPSFLFALVTLITPFTHDYAALLILHGLAGLFLGIFLTVTISMTFRNLPPHLWIIGLAFYGFRLVFGLNTGVSAAGFYIEELGWQWVYWTTTVIAPVMGILAWKSIPSEPVNRDMLRDTDWPGMVLFCFGLMLIYIGIDHGERLNWLSSGTVVACLSCGTLSFVFALLNALLKEKPFGSFEGIRNRNVVTALCIGMVYGLITVSNAMLIPNFLGTIGQLKAAQTGDVLMLLAVISAVLLVPVAMLTRRLDSRIMMTIGFVAFAVSSWLGTKLTHQWGPDDFVVIVVPMAIGHSFVFTGMMAYSVSNSNPKLIVSMLAYVPIVRIVAPVAATAVMVVWLRIREQTHASLIGLYVQSGDDTVVERLSLLTDVYANIGAGLNSAAVQAQGAVASVIAREAKVLAYIDGFQLSFWASLVALLLILTLRASPPNPITQPLIIIPARK